MADLNVAMASQVYSLQGTNSFEGYHQFVIILLSKV